MQHNQFNKTKTNGTKGKQLYESIGSIDSYKKIKENLSLSKLNKIYFEKPLGSNNFTKYVLLINKTRSKTRIGLVSHRSSNN